MYNTMTRLKMRQRNDKSVLTLQSVCSQRKLWKDADHVLNAAVKKCKQMTNIQNYVIKRRETQRQICKIAVDFVDFASG